MGLDALLVLLGMGWLCHWHGQQKNKVIYELKEQLRETQRQASARNQTDVEPA